MFRLKSKLVFRPALDKFPANRRQTDLAGSPLHIARQDYSLVEVLSTDYSLLSCKMGARENLKIRSAHVLAASLHVIYCYSLWLPSFLQTW